jgi:hypothetical protein
MRNQSAFGKELELRQLHNASRSIVNLLPDQPQSILKACGSSEQKLSIRSNKVKTSVSPDKAITIEYNRTIKNESVISLKTQEDDFGIL